MVQSEIKRNDNLLESFSEEFSILSSSIYRIDIYTQEYLLCIDIYFKMLYPHDTYFKLSFKNIIEYSFYWNENYSFYNVESFKLLKKDNLYYISFDPDEDDEGISNNDQDYILSKNIEGCLSEYNVFSN